MLLNFLLGTSRSIRFFFLLNEFIFIQEKKKTNALYDIMIYHLISLSVRVLDHDQERDIKFESKGVVVLWLYRSLLL